MLQWYFILRFGCDHVLIMLHLAPIFANVNNIFGGGSWALWGGSFYSSNTLDRTLVIQHFEHCWTEKSRGLFLLAVVNCFNNKKKTFKHFIVAPLSHNTVQCLLSNNQHKLNKFEAGVILFLTDIQGPSPWPTHPLLIYILLSWLIIPTMETWAIIIKKEYWIVLLRF